jgi:hypothetical protein
VREKGLYNKYKILDRETGEKKDGEYFVLKPSKDPAAFAALKRYAEITPNSELASNIESWLEYLEISGDVIKLPECSYCGGEANKVRPTPFLADIGANMCKNCWDMTKEEYAVSHCEHIPEFEDYPHFK